MRPDHPMLLHGSSTLIPVAVGGQPLPGFWSEWRHVDGERIRSAAHSTPAAAIRWARLSIPIIASAAGPHLVDRLVDRSDPAWNDAVLALQAGADFTLPLVTEPLSFAWHARPALFVRVVDGTPLPHRPSRGVPWG